ncbi:Outer membrane receptor proteins, mostly Fe transport [Novosphingobium sp. CF614]|uniref:TonB-dependent receptor plug domain-containing protein n=1 Tax=Novosphingobium sp. CF614 TaxID=1884364 RepID=UPI0008EEB837|nr:TonB-dependent receptor [Novosphingobium sp. CF614]SFG03653.1 Outer membrane receptor proteins, mostly Fe transport [Novosphingobium sp. CF614]
MRSLPLISLVFCLSAPAAALAEGVNEDVAAPTAKEKQEDSEEPLEVHGNEILVLAPRIRGQLNVPQQPIEVFTEEDISAYGVNSIEELLDAISPQTASGRGRGDGRPVMLLNGQRITSFREMRNIPPEAIRRLEILPEEVALRFGYAANQRVVNIILKDQFAAVTGSGEYNRPTRGGYDNYELETGLFKVAGPRRYNFSAKLDETSMLTEAERGVRQEDSDTPTVAGDPDPARYRSLAAADHELTLEGTMTQGLGENGLGGSITASGGYTHTQTTSLSGLDTVTLSHDGESVLRTLPGPLTTRAVSDEFEAGFGYSRMIGDWQLSTTVDGSYTDTETRVDRRREASALVAAAAAGQLAIDGPLPSVPGAGVDVARNRALSLTSLATLSGRPFRMPAGDANLTVKAGYDFDRTLSKDTRNALGTVKLPRGDLLGGVNLALPLTSADFLGAVGDLTLNLSGGLDRLSDFGTLKDWNAGLTWSPTDTLTFQASYLVDEEAPTLAQLGAPTILTYNVAVYDFTKATTALVTVTSGGNPDLVREKQRDIKLSATWKLPFLDRSNLIVEYFRNRSTNVTQSFPLLTPAIEAAFPGRVTRNADGDLIAIDRRAVTFDEVSSSRLRWGFNLSGSLGGSGGGAGFAGAAGVAGAMGGGSASPGAGSVRAAEAPAQPVTGPRGPMPGDGGAGQAPAARPGFDPSRFEAIRQQLCTPAGGGGAQPDLSGLPEGLRARLAGPDGKVDPEKLAQFKQRACAADGPGQGGFDPERFARMRTALCGEGTPDLAALPERMAERLRGPDGQIDQARLTAVRERMCGAQTPPIPGGEAGMAPPPPDPRAGIGRADGAAQSDRRGSDGPGMGPGPGGGGPPMMGGRGGRGSRWNLSIYHTWRFTDRVNVAPGVPVLNELAGDAIAAGGVPRHAIEAEGGLFKNGYGLRLKAEWDAPARVNGTGLPGSSDLRFGSTFDVSLRLFADLGRNEDLVARMPFLKGSRLSFTVDNLLDSRQKVTDENGDVPLAYQAAFREPQGRVIGIDFRKMF